MQEIDGNDGHLLWTIVRVIHFKKICYVITNKQLITNSDVLSYVRKSGYNQNEDVKL